jgi:hypothetical protein
MPIASAISSSVSVPLPSCMQGSAAQPPHGQAPSAHSPSLPNPGVAVSDQPGDPNSLRIIRKQTDCKQQPATSAPSQP